MVYLEAVIQGFSLKQLFYIYLGDPRGGVHFQWSCRNFMSAVLVGGELLCGCYSSILFNFFFYLLCELLFFGELPLVTAS